MLFLAGFGLVAMVVREDGRLIVLVLCTLRRVDVDVLENMLPVCRALLDLKERVLLLVVLLLGALMARGAEVLDELRADVLFRAGELERVLDDAFEDCLLRVADCFDPREDDRPLPANDGAKARAKIRDAKSMTFLGLISVNMILLLSQNQFTSVLLTAFAHRPVKMLISFSLFESFALYLLKAAT